MKHGFTARLLAAACALALAGQALAAIPPQTLPGTNEHIVPTAIVDASGNQLTTFGGAASDAFATGTVNSATPNAAYTVTLAGGQGVTGFAVSGLTASGATLTIEGSNDGGTTWSAINADPVTGAIFTTLTADMQFRINTGGRTKVRLRVSSTGTGTITVASNASSVSSLVTLGSSIPAGLNSIGGVTGAASAFVDGWDVTEGLKGDTAWTSGSGSGIAIWKAIDRDILLVNSNLTSPIPTQVPTVSIGGTGAMVNGTTSPLIQATASVPITFTAAGGPTQIIAASGSKVIYITHYHFMASAAGTWAWVGGTGVNCGTGTHYLEGASGHTLAFAANAGLSSGSGIGPILITGAGEAACAIVTGSGDESGAAAYAQF